MKYEDYREQIGPDKILPEDWYVLGIDLGTTNTVVCYWNSRNHQPEPIDLSSGFGKIPMPSVVQYRQETGMDEEWVVGVEALETAKLYPKTTVMSVKRHMGSDHRMDMGEHMLGPSEVSAKILSAVLDHVGQLNPKMVLAGVVVSVPYDFDDAARKATYDACRLAGLSDSLICLIEEPKAAALAYNYRHDFNEDEKVLVFDFGGGTLDITIFQVAKKEAEAIYLKVISEGGEAYHGGDNIDQLVYEHLLDIGKKKANIDEDQMTPEHLIELSLRSKETKERLSGVMKYRIPFTFTMPPFVHPLDREAFEQLIQPFIQKTKALVMEALKDGYNGPIDPGSVSRVLLEGGSSQMPWVKTMLSEIFSEDTTIYVSEQPALDIAKGATYYAAMKMGLLNHPELVTSHGDVHFEVPVPHDIGFEILRGHKRLFYPMIRRGTPYPLAKKSHIFTLKGEDVSDMASVDLTILERIKKEDDLGRCRLIGEVSIEGLPERPAGETKLEVTLSIDEKAGTVVGHVKDMGYGNMHETSGFDQAFIPQRMTTSVVSMS